jgi:hypothetical protein
LFLWWLVFCFLFSLLLLIKLSSEQQGAALQSQIIDLIFISAAFGARVAAAALLLAGGPCTQPGAVAARIMLVVRLLTVMPPGRARSPNRLIIAWHGRLHRQSFYPTWAISAIHPIYGQAERGNLDPLYVGWLAIQILRCLEPFPDWPTPPGLMFT